MPDESNLLQLTANRVFADHVSPRVLAAAEAGTWPAAAWAEIEAAGLTRALLPEAAGGYGVEPAEALSILAVAGAHAVPLPLAETMLAGWLLAGAGLDMPDGPLSVAPVRATDSLALTARAGGGWHLSGTVRRVPWGRNVAALAVVAMHRAAPMVALVPAGAWTLEPAHNLALEPRDTLHIAADLPAEAVAPAGVEAAHLRAMGAAMRSQQMAGALGKLVESCTQYALDRVQFGRPIGKFQAIRHKIADMATKIEASKQFTYSVAWRVNNGEYPVREISMAKLLSAQMACEVADQVIQIHGGYGYMKEYEVERAYRDLRLNRIGAGTDEVMLEVIGRSYGL